MIIVPVTTKSLGGDGLAEMTIEIGEFGGDEENGYYQWVTYTPNDQVAVHHDIIITKAAYETEEWGEENLLNYLRTRTKECPRKWFSDLRGHLVFA